VAQWAAACRVVAYDSFSHAGRRSATRRRGPRGRLGRWDGATASGKKVGWKNLRQVTPPPPAAGSFNPPSPSIWLLGEGGGSRGLGPWGPRALLEVGLRGDGGLEGPQREVHVVQVAVATPSTCRRGIRGYWLYRYVVVGANAHDVRRVFGSIERKIIWVWGKNERLSPDNFGLLERRHLRPARTYTKYGGCRHPLIHTRTF